MSSEQTRIALARVAEQLGEDGGLLAEVLITNGELLLGEDDPALGALAAAGPRSVDREAQIACSAGLSTASASEPAAAAY